MAPVEDTQPDSEGTTVIPQRMKHNKLLSRFQGLKAQPIQPAISKIDTHLRSERPSGPDQYPIEVDKRQHFFCEDSVERTEKLTGDVSYQIAS